MPGKHVHFAPEIKVYPLPPVPQSPTPSTPLSSYSLPTVSDSDGPFTPTSWSSPYSYSPLPVTSVSLNPLLSVPSKYGNPAPILPLDLTQVDGPAKSAGALPPAVLFEPATYPPLPYLVIVHKRLPWHIRLVPSDPSLSYVTVRDVLYGLPAFLRQPASKTEYDLIPTEQAKSNVSNAYLRRSKMAPPNQHEAERAAGLRRVDFLEGRGRFCGLTLTTRGPEVWELHTTT